MRIIHTIIGLLITFIGLALLSTTMDAAIRKYDGESIWYHPYVYWGVLS
ncbi:hypothetical protein [Lysinibacillus fusiformis]